MLFEDSFKTITREKEGLFRDRGSMFIGIIFPISSEEEFKLRLKTIKAVHKSANHHCYALRLTPDRSIFKISDDREPSGSAGRPILGQLLSHDLTNAGIVVVRYFGGILLGVPGLINAYKSAAEAAIKNAHIITREITESYEIEFDYSIMNEIMQLLKSKQSAILRNEQNEKCIVEFEISKSKADHLFQSIKGNYQLKDKFTIKTINK